MSVYTDSTRHGLTNNETHTSQHDKRRAKIQSHMVKEEFAQRWYDEHKLARLQRFASESASLLTALLSPVNTNFAYKLHRNNLSQTCAYQ